MLDIIDVLTTVAARHDVEPAQIALAWLLSRQAVTSVIIGVKRLEQLRANLGALDVALTPRDLDELDASSRRPVAYPGWIQTYNAKGRVPEGHAFHGRTWALGQAPV